MLFISTCYSDERIDVMNAQYVYNYRADQVYNNLRDNTNNDTVNYVLDELVSSFCPDPYFVSWTSNDVGTMDTVTQVRNVYEYLGKNMFNNDSTHQLSSVVVTIVGDKANVTANIVTLMTLKIYPAPSFFSVARGLYNNEFVKLNGKWCMSKFVEYTLYQGNLDYTSTLNYTYPFGMIPS